MELAEQFRISLGELNSIVERSRRKLYGARAKRIHPSKDTKILTDWNSLFIVALSKSARAFNQPKYSDAAEKALKFIFAKSHTADGRLTHRYRDGEAMVNANLDDYAFLIWGLIELYETTFKVSYLAEASRLQRDVIKHFWDCESGGFYFISDDDESVLIRSKEFQDGVVPSGNSVSLLNLIRLGRMTGEIEFEKKAEELKKAFETHAGDIASSCSMFLSALDFMTGPTYEIVIVGDRQSQTTQVMLEALRTRFIPNKTVLVKGENDELIEKIARHTKNMKKVNNKTTIYVCSNFTCNNPTNDTKEALESIK